MRSRSRGSSSSRSSSSNGHGWATARAPRHRSTVLHPMVSEAPLLPKSYPTPPPLARAERHVSGARHLLPPLLLQGALTLRRILDKCLEMSRRVPPRRWLRPGRPLRPLRRPAALRRLIRLRVLLRSLLPGVLALLLPRAASLHLHEEVPARRPVRRPAAGCQFTLVPQPAESRFPGSFLHPAAPRVLVGPRVPMHLRGGRIVILHFYVRALQGFSIQRRTG
jgi:hypothetical protein